MSCKTFHKGKYYVTYKRGFEDTKKDLLVTIDKIFENDLLRISMSDDDDPTFLCILNVTRLDYEDLKKQQGLLIDFDNFPAQLVRLLQQCASNNMFMILHQTNPVHLYLEIVEHNEFKRLIHLSLITGPATDADIKQHMANTINNLKKSLSAVKSSASNNEALMSDKCMNMERKINDLTHAITRLEDEKLKQGLDYQEMLKQEREKFNQERLQWQKNLDITSKTQNMTHQEIINRKDKQIDELNFLCKQAQDNIGQLEKQLSEKSHRLELLEKEVQKSHIEVATLNAKYSNLDREATEKDKLYKQLSSKCDYLEKTIKTNSDTIKDLNNLLTTIKKEKTSLEERLNLSESLASKNIESARSTSEQLLKANQIISKQSSELIEIKEKLLCRTAIALEQEKVIESNSKEIEELKLEVVNTKQSVGKLECELETLKEKCEHNEKMLRDRDDTIKNNNMVIQWLHKKLESSYGPTDDMQHKTGTNIQTASSSTPYFISKHNQTNSSQPLSDESTVNFYATSKLSNIEDSPVSTETRGNAINVGLNPKYLKPADDENDKTIKRSEKPKSVHSERSEGKENKNINLPRVDYREKKSGKSTYRTTPVSAFFPR